MPLNFKTTAEIKISDKISESIIGQDEALNIIKKAAKQRRNVLLIGESGTGKSLTGQALAELLPKEKLVDILSYNNPDDDSNPIIKTAPKGEAKRLVAKLRLQSLSSFKYQNLVFIILAIIAVFTPWWVYKTYGEIMAAASLISSIIFIAALAIFFNLNKRMRSSTFQIPKILVDNSQKNKAPFLDASGAQTDALLGSVLHDPLQSFSSNNHITKKKRKKVKISTEINGLLKKHEKELIKKKGYTATYLKKDELSILAEKNGKIQPIEVLSVNKYKSNKPYLYRITTESGKILTLTPEHQIAVNKKGKKQYIPASKLKKGEEVFIKNKNCSSNSR